jgi:hypothetical protein
MWLGPVLFVAVSVFLWKYVGAVFVPELLARCVFALLPGLGELELVVWINTAVLYFGLYFVFAAFWPQLRLFLRNAFVASIVLWLVNVIVLFPILGRGLLGYRTPQGWLAASFPLLVAHWMFARGLQFQDRHS